MFSYRRLSGCSWAVPQCARQSKRTDGLHRAGGGGSPKLWGGKTRSSLFVRVGAALAVAELLVGSGTEACHIWGSFCGFESLVEREANAFSFVWGCLSQT